MAKNDDMKTLAEVEIKTEESDQTQEAKGNDVEQVMDAAGKAGGEIVRKVVQAGEEALDRLGVNRDK